MGNRPSGDVVDAKALIADLVESCEQSAAGALRSPKVDARLECHPIDLCDDLLAERERWNGADQPFPSSK